jgi:hypothetical protein
MFATNLNVAKGINDIQSKFDPNSEINICTYILLI